jgi:hypothetical protein
MTSITYRTAKGHNPIDSLNLLLKIVKKHKGKRLTNALYKNEFISEREYKRITGA